MKLEHGVDVAYVNVISKFGYDQINISYGNVLLKNISKSQKGQQPPPKKKILKI